MPGHERKGKGKSVGPALDVLRAEPEPRARGLRTQYVSDQPTTVIVSTSKSIPVLTMLSVLPCPSK